MSGRASSSSSFSYQWTYDVFLSFRGGDTDDGFTGNLFNALRQKGIHTFMDWELKKGDEITASPLKEIEESRMAIIVFSKNYAYSTFCLDELVKILQCFKGTGRYILPIFYDVEPSDVRHQRGNYGIALAMHQENFKANERVLNWTLALREAANMSGYHLSLGYEFEFIQRITEEISSKLSPTFLHISDYPVGLEYRTAEVISLLSLKSNEEAFMVGIHGIDGIGKTTIARAVYNSIANQFDKSYFLAAVRENSMKHGLVQLQETLISNLIGAMNIKLSNVYRQIDILKNRLCRKKVLLVLDDVDNLEQVSSLAGRQDWFGYGSRIIITTRDKHLLNSHGVEKLYEVKKLNDHEAFELFSWHAFKRSEPDPRYMDIAKLVVLYAKGLPLSLNVIGSDLFGKTVEEWKSVLKKYERKEMLDALKVSYDSLHAMEKEIFLDIACFFNGNLVEDVKKALDASHSFAEIGIRVLIEKSLATIDETNRVKMDGFIQDFGREVAQEDSPFDPGKRRRLWHHEDVLEVLTKNTGTDAIEGIILDMANIKQAVQLRADAFEKLPRLRILIFRNAQVSGVPKHLLNHLKMLESKKFTSPCLLDDFHPETLAALNTPHSHLTMDQPFKELGLSEAMADEGPASTSSFNHGRTYDVYMSFSSDTRYSFIGNLCNALDQKGINTFKDDKELKKGEIIFSRCLKAMEESRIAIIVFSKNYASSVWCLDELVNIIDSMEEKGKLVCPVFYKVDPSDVKYQRGSYGRSMTEHEANFKNSKETVERVQNWRVALRKGSTLCGWHVKDGCYEFEFIEMITKEISSKLSPTFLHTADYPVGLKYRTPEVISLLSLESDEEALMVGIHGLGGIGKTTIARVVYNSIANQFEGSCFLAAVRKNSMKHGLVELQETLLLNFLGEKNTKLGNVFRGIPILKNRLCRKKVLLVLDDVDNLDQVSSLAGKQDWFGCGSRIIITTRDKSLLITHGVKKLYEVKELNDHESLQLLSWNAFKRSEPDPSYMNIAKLVVQYAEGLPLCLIELGSFLFGRPIEEWKSALERYAKRPSDKILEVFKVSYDNLDDNEKEIFLLIACYFNGNLVEDVEKALDASGFYAKYGIRVLIDKSLASIDETNRVKMHGIIQDFGRAIARRDSPFDHGKRRRLWHYEDVLEAQRKNTVCFSKGPKYLSNRLTVLQWLEYPSSYLPAAFHPTELVILDLQNSCLQSLEPVKECPMLRSMNLRGSKNLVKMPDFSGFPNLEKLDLEGCTALLQLDPSNTVLPKLTFLNLRNCKSLISISNNLFGRSSLETLNLGGCSKLVECLNFNSLKSSIELKLLSDQHCPFLSKMLCYLFISLLEDLKYNELVLYCLILLIYNIWSVIAVG